MADLLTRASGETDSAAREAALTEAQEAIWATWPCLWAFVPNAVLARRSRIQDVELKPINSYDLALTRLEA